jgi:hypothetical protein
MGAAIQKPFFDLQRSFCDRLRCLAMRQAAVAFLAIFVSAN